MTGTIARTAHTNEPAQQAEFVTATRDAGVAGAGGAGFPTYAKWQQAAETDYLLMNHQESEPNYFIDKWLGEAHAPAFATLFDTLLDELFEVVVISAKWKDRKYLRKLEALTDATVRRPEELPLDPVDESGVVVAYTENTYQYGMESVLLTVVADTVIGDDLPMDHGWLVQNTETLYNSYRAWTNGSPVTSTYVHVGGNVPQHRFLEVPLGTPVRNVLDRAFPAGLDLPPDAVLAHGGPGWCFPIEDEAFGVHKHTNGILVLDEKTVEQNTLGGNRIDVLDTTDWTDRDLETQPTATLEPASVRVPLITNADLSGVVSPSEPRVHVGEQVHTGEVIATPAADGVSIPQHASIDGTVTAVENTHITIREEV